MAVATTAKHPKELQTRNEECGTSEEQTWKRKYAAIKRKVEEVEQVSQIMVNKLVYFLSCSPDERGPV